MTHPIPTRQLVETLEVIALLDINQELLGVAVIEITVLNEWKLDKIDLKGRKASDFACLYDCIRERLIEAGYDLRNFDFGKI